MNLVTINENINRLLTNIWAIVSFFKEYLVDPSKDVTLTFQNADGSETENTFPNISKQNEALNTWKDNTTAVSRRENPIPPNFYSNTKYWVGADGETPPNNWSILALANGDYSINFTRIPMVDADISKEDTVAYNFGVNDVSEIRRHLMIGEWNDIEYGDGVYRNYGTDYYALGIEISIADEDQPDNGYLIIGHDTAERFIGWNMGNNTVWACMFISVLDIPEGGEIYTFNNALGHTNIDALTDVTNGWIPLIGTGYGFGGSSQCIRVKPVKNGTYKFAILLPYGAVGNLGNRMLYAGAISKTYYTHGDITGE